MRLQLFVRTEGDDRSLIAVTGAKGQLGREICRQAGSDAIPLFREVLDLTKPDMFPMVLDRFSPDILINCAAWTAVDLAEKEREACFTSNALSVSALAGACRERGILLVQVSTDYVFGGDSARRIPYFEDDARSPVNFYGSSKMAGEDLARECEHLVVRTCGLYSAGESGPVRGRNFADTMLVVSEDRPSLRVVNDQFCTPSYVPHVAKCILEMCSFKMRGVWHVVNSGFTTWHGFAEELLRLARPGVTVEPIPTSLYPTPAPRPHYSVLSTGKLAGAGLALPDWRIGVGEYLSSASNQPFSL